MTTASLHFKAAHAVLQGEIDQQRLPGVSAAVLRHGELVDEVCLGLADVEAGTPLRPDHIHRAFSNTKLVTSVLVLMMVDEGQLSLDEPVRQWLPGLGQVRVLRPGATDLGDTLPLARDITIRHLLSHQAGLSHGVFDPGTPIYNAYLASGVRNPALSLAQMIEPLASLPLLYQPGEGWEYSMAPDVLARVVEVITGKRFGEALQQRLLGPLGMVDTGFVLRPAQLPRLAALYRGDLMDPMKPGLKRLDETPWPGAYLRPVARESAAGGLVTTQADMLALLRRLLPGPDALLKPDTLAALYADQLDPGRCVAFAVRGAMPSLGFGLGGAITRQASAFQGASAVGEMQWGGLAGTHWFIAPSAGLVGVLMTQRFMGFWHPFWFQYKAQVYRALN
jgi:CubicO group peptidase (beta-lactamase class C family)